MDPLSSMIRISIDGGQGFLKVIVNVFDKTNKNEIYIDSGVKRCFILAIVEDVCEDNGNLQKILSRLNLDNVTYHLAFDLKCANSIFGLSSHSGKYACLWCEGECSLESGTPRTLGSFDYWYNLFVENGAKQLEMKDFKNVISPRLVYLDKNAEDEVNHLVPPPELHILMGIVTLLGRLLLDHWPLFKNWLKEHYILLRGYHGIGFDGNNSNKLLEKVDILERDVLASQTNLLPIVHCLRKFEKVKECTFGYELGSNASSVIEEFKVSFCDLQQYAKMHLNTELKVTWKVHIVICHILPFVKFNCCSLGSYAEQTGEAVHSAFKPSWSQYKRRIEHKDYAKRLKSAVATFCLDKM